MASIAVNTLRSYSAKAMLARGADIFVAIGNGSSGWDSVPVAPTAYDTDIVAEHGRRRALQVSFATPNEAGTIVVDTGNYSLSADPTPYLYILGSFNFNDAVGQVIREVGVFGDCMLNAGVDGSQYITAGQIADKGMLLVADRFTSFTRVISSRNIFEYVIELI